jgi:hypothetical protein
MHVYALNTNSDVHVFAKEADLLPSIKISYHKFKDVKIVQRPRFVHYGSDIMFDVTYTPQGEDTPKTDVLRFHHCCVWDEPCHL